MSKNNTVYIGKNKNFWDRNRRSGGYLLRKRAGQIAVSVTRALLLFGLCFMIIQPMLTRFSMSLMEENLQNFIHRFSVRMGITYKKIRFCTAV